MKKILKLILIPIGIAVGSYLIVAIVFAPQIKRGIDYARLLISNQEFEYEIKVAFDEKQAEEKKEITTFKIPETRFPKQNEHFGYITCDRISLSAPLLYGDTLQNAEYGAGLNTMSSFPGFGHDILISSHNYGYFMPLQYIKEGDVITLTTNFGTFEYQVTGTLVAKESDYTPYQMQREYERLILYTCYPFQMTIAPKTEKLYVYANKISGPVAEW